MKYYYIQDQNGRVEIQERKKGITITRKQRLKEQGKKIIKVVEIDDNFLKLLKKTLDK